MDSVGPRSAHRSASSGYTLVSSLDSLGSPRLDAGGLLQPGGVGWSIDWWIGAEDRWHFPSSEASVRQRRSGPGPVIETVMRIPSGDAIERVYGVSSARGELTVIEVENDSPVPVALALAVRPYGIDGVVSEPAIRITDTEVLVDGVATIGLPRPANDFSAEAIDLAEPVSEGKSLGRSAESAGPGSNAVLIYPVPHRTKLRFVLAGPGSGGSVSEPVPEVESVARGWQSLVGAGGRLEVPDPGISAQAGVARARLFGGASELAERVASLAPGAGRHLYALALSGARHDVEFSLAALAQTFPRRLRGDPSDVAAVVAGAGRGANLVSDEALLAPLLETVAQLTTLVEKRGDPGAVELALGGLARVASALGQGDVAADLRTRAHSAPFPGVPEDIAALGILAEGASEAGAWGHDEVGPAARFWIGLRGQLVAEDYSGSEGGSGGTLALLSEFPSAWRGGKAEAVSLPTDFGPVSFAVRWHGYRPALLWDLEARGPVTITCPGLDVGWSTTEPRGEALLSGSADELPENPSAGDSFA